MLKALRNLYFALLLATGLSAEAAETICPPAITQPPPEIMQEAIRKASDRGFLWRITKNGRTSFLYGTIHVAKFHWMFPGTQVLKAILSSNTMALEMDVMDLDIQSRLAKGMLELPRTALPAALVKRLRIQADANCVAYESLAETSAEMQILTLAIMAGRRDGLEVAYAIDAVLAGIGHSAKMKMVSLETPERQLDLIKIQGRQEIISFVDEGLTELESGRSLKLINRIAKIWADSDYKEMERFPEWCECLKTENERKWMRRALDDRNPDLAKNIDALHSNGKNVFAAVGSLHMFGTTGLPQLMEKRGYLVERVTFEKK